MDPRVEKFFQDAQQWKCAEKAEKEASRLRKYLFKNQERRFTDREQSYLFQAVQMYVTLCIGAAEQSSTPTVASSNVSSGDGSKGISQDSAVGLLEDALKMPFTVFGTSHKKVFLRWYDKLSGILPREANNAKQTSHQIHGSLMDTEQRMRLQVIDVERSVISGLIEKMTLMSPETGETYEVEVGISLFCTPESSSHLKTVGIRFEEGEDEYVEAVYNKQRNAILILMNG
ncbi:hypothetical protein CEUSTIGMA_g1131.t1 [Chlamydomonas eustigma]|uniref:Uncharacterized protein n=1 Tax=Chlamydomonas eustigma TaxID=1157962 RepID=A0A250WT33_9CHLO|nr:hypothetical protein CEUSTIGMA_g1131.t1 [Chlamydomonas eustigma]|eukprot:GAX73680.1 hypothetical protein CEUSTIGMA_g1131.t1 [Chlamydomonas eustigma]